MVGIILDFYQFVWLFFTNRNYWSQATPPKDTKSYEGSLFAPNPPERNNIYLTMYWTLFHQLSSLIHTFTDTQVSTVPIMTSPWESPIVTLPDSHNSAPLILGDNWYFFSWWIWIWKWSTFWLVKTKLMALSHWLGGLCSSWILVLARPSIVHTPCALKAKVGRVLGKDTSQTQLLQGAVKF